MTEPVPTLFLVATPIGNLKDITLRALEILKSVPLIAAEDTRHTRKLLTHYQITTPIVSYFEHNRDSRIPQLIQHLQYGNSLALVTDAGTPGVSDPAYKLIRAVLEKGFKVEAIPGPSAALAALVSSGLPTDRFLFEGFLPVRKGRKKRLQALREIDATLIFFESPQRLVRTLRDCLNIFGDRPAVVARELTKIHEELIRGTLSEVLTYFNHTPPRGECTLLIGKNDAHVYFK